MTLNLISAQYSTLLRLNMNFVCQISIILKNLTYVRLRNNYGDNFINIITTPLILPNHKTITIYFKCGQTKNVQVK